MKNWSGQLFSLALLSLVAALTFWLKSSLSADTENTARPDDLAPDAIIENFEIRRLDEQGRLKYRLHGPHLSHFPHDDSTEIQAPRLTSYREDGTVVNVRADKAIVTQQGETVHLIDNVVLMRPASPRNPELVALTPKLMVEPEAGLAHTDSPIRINQGASWVTGIGARIDHNKMTFELLSNVRGYHVASRAQP